jgi:methionyl aminopeptidase
METPCRTTDVAFLGDRDEVTNLRKAHLTRECRDRAAGATRCVLEIETVLDGQRAVGQDVAVPIEIHDARAVARLRAAGRVAAQTLAHVGAKLRPGVSTSQIDAWVREDTARRGGRPSQLGYHGFPAAVCTSRNSVVCHGIPRREDVLVEADIVNIDVTTCLDGFHGDTSATFVIGDVSRATPEARHVVDVARRCRDAGVAEVRDGARLGDIGAAIVELARREGCTVVRDYGGHGIGRLMHADPHVSHVGTRASGLRMRAGMAFTIEPMINLGGAEVRVLDDGWTVVTVDGRLSAQFEHTVLVTRDGCEILTRSERG